MSIRISSGLRRRDREEEEEEEEEEEGEEEEKGEDEKVFPCPRPSSRRTATVAAEVCCLPPDSVTGTRCTLWTPASFLRLSATPRPFILAAASLTPSEAEEDAEEEEEEEDGPEAAEEAPESLRSSRHSQPAEAEYRE